MSKRKNISELEDAEMEVETLLPVEIIMKIFTYLNDIKDIHNCMELSKEIRDSIFKTPRIMRRMQLQFSINFKFSAAKLEFLKSKGGFIRRLRLQCSGKSVKLTRFILHQVPNLEELNYENLNLNRETGFDAQFLSIPKLENLEEPANLSKLRTLNLQTFDFYGFMENFKNLKSLEKFIFVLDNLEHEKPLLDFLIRQDNLKELNLITVEYDVLRTFPSINFSTEVKFQLKKLKLHNGFNINDNLLKFFQNQVENLEELDMDCLNEEILEILFKKSKKLKKIIHNGIYESPLFSDLYPHWTLNTVEFLKSSCVLLSLNSLYKMFPNLKNLKCREFLDTTGNFDKLYSLEIYLASVDKLQNLKFPNLKYLKIEYFMEVTDENYWIDFIKNVPNIENLIIKSVKNQTDQKFILKYLKNFTKLRSFQIWYWEQYDDYYERMLEIMSEEEIEFYEHSIPHKVSIDLDNKIIKSDEFMLKMKMLRENFEDFELVEYDDPEVQQWLKL